MYQPICQCTNFPMTAVQHLLVHPMALHIRFIKDLCEWDICSESLNQYYEMLNYKLT